MKVKKNMKAFKICSQNVHLRRGFQYRYNDKDSRERMMNFANYKKRKPQFGMMMCFGMVIVMTFYNLLLNGAGGYFILRRCVRTINWIHYCTIN